MLLDKNLRLPGTSLWARFVNGGLTWPTVTLLLVSMGVDIAVNDPKLVTLSAPALLAARIVPSALYVYFIGGFAVIGVRGVRRNLRVWREEGATLRLRLRRGLYWIFLIIFIVWIACGSSITLALLWAMWPPYAIVATLMPAWSGLSALAFLFLFLWMATYAPRKWLSRPGAPDSPGE